jgi:hypothetical protein
MQKLVIERTIPAPGRHPCGLAWDGAHLWHSDVDTDLIYQLDPTDGKMTGSIPCPDVRTDLSYDGANLWQIAGRAKRIVVIDPRQARILRDIDLGSDRENACGLCVSEENFFVGFKGRGLIEKTFSWKQRGASRIPNDGSCRWRYTGNGEFVVH